MTGRLSRYVYAESEIIARTYIEEASRATFSLVLQIDYRLKPLIARLRLLLRSDYGLSFVFGTRQISSSLNQRHI